MNSEKRDKLLEVPPPADHRRAASADRRPSALAKRHLSPPPPAASLPSVSAPDILSPAEIQEEKPQSLQPEAPDPTIGGGPDSNIPAGARQVDYEDPQHEQHPPLDQELPLDVVDAYSEHGSHRSGSDVDDIRLQEELEAKWILNLSMHFRDMSDREKFFVTYAEEPNKWRRVTVSCDYRQLEPESLEADLKTLHYQRDKSSRIYEAIRDSLPDIQFYDTVTNLKLQTSDGRLHVHVTEDVNETIPYPPTSAIDHLDCKRFKEHTVSFDSHISGFVYKVSVNNRVYIKKEIPGPDAVEEFLYEINALNSLQDSQSVIGFEGIIVDERNESIKGLLISYAEQGALVDMIYDYKLSDHLPWARRERWARHIVQGLSEIHEAGFVQGDFTLSNIVIDHNDDAKIIDINRRGCPVGWEPPELARLIESGQRISIYIGVKSDLYQLGMVLWALAEQQDEPERQDRPLHRTFNRHSSNVPDYFKDMVRLCLIQVVSRESVSTHVSDKVYIDPATAVDLEDISQHRGHTRNKSSFVNINRLSTEHIGSSGSYIMPNNISDRGQSPDPPRSMSRQGGGDSPYLGHLGHRSVMSLDDSELDNELASLPASRDTRWEQVYVDGDTKLVQRGCGEIGGHDFAAQEVKDICITSPPTELENSFLTNKASDDTPLDLHTTAEPQPADSRPTQSGLQEPADEFQLRGVGSKASFSDRVHQLAQTHLQQTTMVEANPTPNLPSWIPDPATLTNLEHEIAMDSSVTSSAMPTRTNTGFSMFESLDHTKRMGTGFSIAQGHHLPLHQDSGFAEPERISYESERTMHSLDENLRGSNILPEEEERMFDPLWDEDTDNSFGQGMKGAQLTAYEHETPEPTKLTLPSIQSSGVSPPSTLAVEQKGSNTTIRPPSILIPDFHHTTPKVVDEVGLSGKQHAYYELDDALIDDDEVEPASNDLADYLSHSISYSQHSDYYSQNIQEKISQEPKV
ncbi:hypothetical protein IQ07DRAFT_614759 [Pyrenochaeta sp. DS3sAY3a]|nr:hypothetical protein IQ07DRAFT_614759 [Pyrenochaeta sp. DS3sAY3a]